MPKAHLGAVTAAAIHGCWEVVITIAAEHWACRVDTSTLNTRGSGLPSHPWWGVSSQPTVPGAGHPWVCDGQAQEPLSLPLIPSVDVLAGEHSYFNIPDGGRTSPL